MQPARQISRSVTGITIFLLISLLGELVLVPFGPKLLELAGTGERFRAFLRFAGTVTMFAAAFPAAMLYYLFAPSGGPPEDRGLLSPGSFLLFVSVSYALVYVGNLIGTGFMQLVRPGAVNEVEEMVLHSSGIYLLLVTTVLGPVCEELLYRKFLMDGLRGLGDRTAILVSALCFALSHGNFHQFFYTLFIGLFFGYVYLRTGNVWNTVLLHVSVNLFGGLVPALLFGTDGTGGSAAARTAFGLLIQIFLFCGLFAFFRFVRHLRFEEADAEPPFSAGWFRAVFVNPGMLVFLFAAAACFALSLIPG